MAQFMTHSNIDPQSGDRPGSMKSGWTCLEQPNIPESEAAVLDLLHTNQHAMEQSHNQQMCNSAAHLAMNGGG